MSTYGSIFKVTTYGESHCASVGAIIDGIPPVCTCDSFWTQRMIDTAFRAWNSRHKMFKYNSVAADLVRAISPLRWVRFPSIYHTRTHNGLKRDEKDLVHLQSGIEHGVTLGTPIGLLVKNEDHRPKDYSETDLYPRPSHADWTYLEKYGVKASSGGG